MTNPSIILAANRFILLDLTMPSFETTVAEIRDSSRGGFIVILKPHELETTTNLKEVLLEPKFATAGGKIHHDHIELFCDERPPIHEGQILMVRSLDPHGNRTGAGGVPLTTAAGRSRY